MLRAKQVDFADIKEQWLELEETGDVPTVFQTYDWINSWHNNLGHGNRTELIASFDGTRVVGIAPFYLTRMTLKGLPTFKMLFLMGAPKSDYLAFIVRKEYGRQAVESLLNFAKALDWDISVLTDLRTDVAANMMLPYAMNEIGLRCVTLDHNKCPYIALPATYDEYIHSVSKNSRRNIVKNCNRLEREHRTIYRKVEDIEKLPLAMDDFFRLHAARWGFAGKTGTLVGNDLQNFHREAARRLFRYLDLKELLINGRTVATTYSYDYNGSRGIYLPGWDPEYERYSIGQVMLAYNIKDAIERGLNTFDFMRGEEDYKYHFTKNEVVTKKIIAAKSGFKLSLYLALEKASGKR